MVWTGERKNLFFETQGRGRMDADKFGNGKLQDSIYPSVTCTVWDTGLWSVATHELMNQSRGRCCCWWDKQTMRPDYQKGHPHILWGCQWRQELQWKVRQAKDRTENWYRAAQSDTVSFTGGRVFIQRWKHLCLRCCAGHFLFVPSFIKSDLLVNEFRQGETLAGNWRAGEETGGPVFFPCSLLYFSILPVVAKYF